MGFLTTITLYNDHNYNLIDADKFVEELIKRRDEANREHKAISWGGAIVQPSRHADDYTIYVHYGNMVLNLNPYCKDFEDLMDSPEILKKFIDVADGVVKDAKKKLKEAKKLAANKKK